MPVPNTEIYGAAMAVSLAALTVVQEVEKAEENQRTRRRKPQPYRPPMPYIQKEFDLNDLSDGFCRFTPPEIQRLSLHFNLRYIQYPNRIICPPETALCLVLYRLARPRGLADTVEMFGRSFAWLSQVYNTTITWLVRKYRGFLHWDDRRLVLPTLQQYADAVYDAGGPRTIWGFVDGTIRGICRPGGKDMDQQDWWSGYKKFHGMKYQGVMTPDGLISSLAGPVSGKTGDFKLWDIAGLSVKIRALTQNLEPRDRHLLYGDAAYKAGGFGITGAKAAKSNGPLSAKELKFNREMGMFRVAIENGFGIVSNLWQANGFTRGFRAGSSPVASYYIVSVLLTNCMTCLRNGNQVSEYYQLPPPTLEEYLGLPPWLEIPLEEPAEGLFPIRD